MHLLIITLNQAPVLDHLIAIGLIAGLFKLLMIQRDNECIQDQHERFNRLERDHMQNDLYERSE